MLFWFFLMLGSVLSVGWLHHYPPKKRLAHCVPFIFFVAALVAQKLAVGQVDLLAALMFGILVFGLQLVIVMGKRLSK